MTNSERRRELFMRSVVEQPRTWLKRGETYFHLVYGNKTLKQAYELELKSK